MMHHLTHLAYSNNQRSKRPYLYALLFSFWIAVTPVMASTEEYSITQWTVASGGQSQITGGPWQLSGTIGQWEATSARALSGGRWHLTGGFWATELSDRPASIFQDRFQLKSSALTSSKDQQDPPLHEGAR